MYRSYTKLGGPVAPCTHGVQPLDRSSKLTRPWRTICSEGNFCTAPQVGRLTVAIGLNTQAVPNCEVLLLLVHQVYDIYNTQAYSLGRGEQSTVNGIFIHLLYGSVRLSQIRLL